MATKTLTIMEDAYDILKEHKLESESFSEEIRRVFAETKKKPLSAFFGILSEEEGEAILKAKEMRRKINLKHARKRMEMFQ